MTNNIVLIALYLSLTITKLYGMTIFKSVESWQCRQEDTILQNMLVIHHCTLDHVQIVTLLHI